MNLHDVLGIKKSSICIYHIGIVLFKNQTTESSAAWERLEQKLRSSVTEKDQQLTVTGNKLDSMEVELSDLHASSERLTQHNADTQRLLAERDEQSAQLKSQVRNSDPVDQKPLFAFVFRNVWMTYKLFYIDLFSYDCQGHI